MNFWTEIHDSAEIEFYQWVHLTMCVIYKREIQLFNANLEAEDQSIVYDRYVMQRFYGLIRSRFSLMALDFLVLANFVFCAFNRLVALKNINKISRKQFFLMYSCLFRLARILR